MRAYLIRVGIDQAFGDWNAPIDPDTGEFVYVPIPEAAGTRFQPGMATTYAPFRAALDAFASLHPDAASFSCSAPDALDDLSPHLDPDFDRLTYGDNGLRRGKDLCDLEDGDLVVFFAGLRPVRPCAHRLVYALIGLFRVAEAVRLRDVPRRRWAENAHTRKLRHGPDDVIVRARPGESGRLQRAIAIGEYRDGAYRVRREVLRAWGDISCRDGFIQRSAVPPAFLDPQRFLAWFEAQSPVLLPANNPARGPSKPPRPVAARSAPARAAASPTASEPIVLVHLRQPGRNDPRTDPMYEFGSFGTTGCHGSNLLHDDGATGVRLGFVQPGPGAMRLVLLTPPVHVVDHGRRCEATWAPVEMPLRFGDGVLLIDGDGNSDVPGMRLLLERGNRETWLGQFSSNFRSRTTPLPDAVARELAAAWDRCVAEGGAAVRAKHYWEALPFAIVYPDMDRASTRARNLAESRAGSSPRCRRCR